MNIRATGVLVPVALLAVLGMRSSVDFPSGPADRAALVAAWFPLLSTPDDSADAEIRTVMPMTTALPWGAVGFLDNGCTATLIDAQHVLAASHCFTWDYDKTAPDGKQYAQGDWQPTLAFFPNYHPDRANPPRYLVDRAIVGSRTQTLKWVGPDPTPDLAAAADWGIGHLETPVAGFPSLEIEPAERWQYPMFLTYSGYPRDSAVFPKQAASYPEPAAGAWPTSDPSGYCVNFTGACWWIPALADPNCLALQADDGFVTVDDFSCPIIGGNSGTAALWDAGPPGTPLFRITGVFSGGGGFWNATQFQYAPRYASGVAVAAADDGSARTQVFATDRDLGRVVGRERNGFAASDPFHYYRDLGSVSTPERIAAFKLANGRPQLVVVTAAGTLLTAHVAGTAWQQWKPIPLPTGVIGFVDVDAAYGADGLPYLYALADGGPVYFLRALSTGNGASWAPWQMLPMGTSGRAVTAVRHEDGRQQIFVVADNGGVVTRWQVDSAATAPWTPAGVFSDTSAVEPLVDLDAGWQTDGTVQVVGVGASGRLHARRVFTESPQGNWSDWFAFSAVLYAPAAANAPMLGGVTSVAFSRLQEAGAVVPVVFATDDRGNVYFTAPQTVGRGWQPWRSFYK